MRVSELRQSILQMAVQGKLVPQDMADEPASILLARIRTEKEQMVIDGKLRREKTFSQITIDETTHALPCGWVWCRLSEIADLCLGKMLDKAKNKGDFYPYLRNLNVQWFRFDLSNLASMRIESKEFDRYSVKKGDLVLCEGGYPGKGAIWDKNTSIFLQKALHRIRFFTEHTNEYLLYYIFYLFESKKLANFYTGAGIQHLTGKSLNEIPIPLPPLAEQHRIVAKVNELMVMCDELEVVEKEVDALETKFANDLPRALLQCAVQGKLVPQDKTDEHASVLLKRIKAEKEQLIKAGKLKREKPLSVITEEDIPYDLPDGWVWCRLGDIIQKSIGGGTPSKQDSEYWDGTIPWASVKDLNCDILEKTRDHISEKGLLESASNLIPAGVIIICTRMGLGKIVINTVPVAINQDLRALFISQESLEYAYFINWYKVQDIQGDGMTVKGITIETISNMLFPLPPLAEQHRIVAKVNDLMLLCDSLKAAHNLPEQSELDLTETFEDDEYNGLAIAARGDEIPGEVFSDMLEICTPVKN